MKKIIIQLLDLFRFKKSYSQHGEDLVLHTFFEEKNKGYKGFYIDIGAHHPIRFSNTHSFYLKGWRGINVDATPNSMTLFKLLRPKDINIESGVADKPGILKFYCFDEPALNGFNKEVATERNLNTKYKILKEVDIPVVTLNQIIETHAPHQNIDFLSIDVEGFDFKVLQSIDLKIHRPRFILIEDTFDSAGFSNSEIRIYLQSYDYRLVARTKITSVYKAD